MAYGRIYYVTFEMHKDCKIYNYIFHCWAWDAKEAKDIAKRAWEKNHEAHQFHMYAHRSKAPDSQFLRVRGWNGMIHSGKEECLDKFICLDFRAWRVNGINQYGPRAGQRYNA